VLVCVITPETVSAVSVPTLVILGCAAVVTVPAVVAVSALPVQLAEEPVVEDEVKALPVQEPLDPVQLPVTAPVKGPAKPVAVRMPVEGTNESLPLEHLSGKLLPVLVTQVG